MNNPSEDNFWWCNNQGEGPGIDPLMYDINKYDFVNINDFVENGYDDIINLKTNDIYNIADFFPYYNGRYGNIYINDYFEELYNDNEKYMSSTSNSLPETVLDNVSGTIGPNCIRYKLNNLNDVINKCDVNDVVNDVINQCDINDDISSENHIMKLISYKLNHYVIRKILDQGNVTYKIMQNIKESFKKCEKYDTDFINYLFIFSEMFKIRYIIYTFKDYNCTIKIIGKKYDEICFLYKVDNIYYIIKNEEQHSNEYIQEISK
tara:strand:- start:273 stop:1061 length:789 start_codon:yes stop_codon:yes gene_type:complete